MLRFAVRQKRTPSSVRHPRAPTMTAMTPSLHIQRAKVSNILRRPHLQTKLTIGQQGKTGTVYESTVLDDIPFDLNPKLYLYFESKIFERLRRKLTKAVLPQSWGPDIMYFYSNFETEVYRRLMKMGSGRKQVTLDVDVRKGPMVKDSFLWFRIRETSPLGRPEGKKSTAETAVVGVPAGVKEEAKALIYERIKEEAGATTEKAEMAEKLAHAAEMAEIAAEIAEVIAHFLPLAIIGPILGPLGALLSGSAAVLRKKCAAYLWGVELGFKAARELEEKRPGFMYRISAEELEVTAGKWIDDWRWIKYGYLPIEEARKGFNTVVTILNRVKKIVAMRSGQLADAQVRDLQRKYFLDTTKLGEEEARKKRIEIKEKENK